MMKVAVSSSGKDLDAHIDPRFGRCAFFAIVDTDDMGLESFANENIALGGGAGIQSAQFVASTGAKAVITGHCGPNAVRTLSAAGVELFVDQTGTVRAAVEKYKRGELRPATGANVADHHGMGRGAGMGCGGGMGRGGGRMGRGMNTTDQSTPSRPEPESLTDKQELALLKEQMQDIAARISRLEKNH